MKNSINSKRNKGITLIALVITIIVLLILAGVTIQTLTGDNGLLTKAGESKNEIEETKLEEEIHLAFIENEADKYAIDNTNLLNKIKVVFEKSYGSGNVEVTKSGKNLKAKVKDSKTAYRIKADGTVEKYEEMDPTYVYGKLDNNDTLFLRSTQLNGYNRYTNCWSINSNWNETGDASKGKIKKIVIEEPIAPTSLSAMFYEFNNLESIEKIENLHTENATSFSTMFCHCEKITELDVSRFDTSKSTEFSRMFDACYKLKKIDISGFDTSNCKTMAQMFWRMWFFRRY